MAKSNNTQDEAVQKLFAIVQQKKAEIAKAEKPNWETNCSFSYYPDSGARINLQVVTDISELSRMLGFLIQLKENHDKAIIKIGYRADFRWLGFTYEQWESDIITRANKIQISEKKKELNNLEERLDKLISPELKAKMELEAITKLLEE